MKNKLSNLNQNIHISFKENKGENVIYKTAAIVFRLQCVRQTNTKINS